MGMTRTVDYLKYTTVVLLLVVAGIHLYWGIPRFTAYASVGTMPDPRPLAFVLSGHAIVLAITLVVLGVIESRRTYLPGIALMLVHLVGYAAWHTVLSHGGEAVASGGHSHDHIHVGDIVLDLIQHLVNSPLALGSKLTELTVVLLLSSLYLMEAPNWCENDQSDS